ncbi:MAG: DUF4974 domain-containing protein [Chitinophagaceae bacterium]
MSRDKIWHLFARKLTGEASKEELQELELLAKEDSSLYYELQSIVQLWEQDMPVDEEYLEATYHLHYEKMKKLGVEPRISETVSDDTFPSENTFFSYISRYKLSLAFAALLILVSVAGWLFSGQSKNEKVAKTINKATKAKNEVTTRKGSNAEFKLPDGTTVWLNSGSTLNYDKINEAGVREVYLTGEAFFDVVKNPKRPFIIHTNTIDVKVLGTAFNVRAYPDDKTVETSLVRGRVEVTVKNRPQEKYFLKPNQKLVLYNEAITEPRLKSIDPATSEIPVITIKELSYMHGDSAAVETAWIRNKLSFEDEQFVDLARRMGRWYDVTIEFKNKALLTETLTGEFDGETLTQALEALKVTTSFKYKIEGKRVIIF